MSLKGVELQIAIPKTFDVGKIAEEHHQNTISQQMNANDALKKDTERKQLTVTDTEQIMEIAEDENNGDKNQNRNQKSKNKKNNKKQNQKEAQHPFKGNFIDYSG